MKNVRMSVGVCSAVTIVVGTTLSAYGAVGDTLAVVTVPNLSPSGIGIGIALDCEDPATLFYTNSFSPQLHKMDAAGNDLGSVPLADAAGNLISFGAISWDDTRKKLWAGTDRSGSPVKVYLIDPNTGIATFQFTATTPGFGFCDGIAYDATDDSVYVSDDVASVIDQHSASTGAFIRALTPKNAVGNTLGIISGVLVGQGDLLYLGRNGFGEIVKVKKSDGSFLSVFASPGGRDEDLECDTVSFPGKVAIWSKDAFDDTVTAIEVEPDTCECVKGVVEIPLDIKPQSCPNPLGRGGGMLPVAVLGTGDIDVTQINIASLTLAGVPPIRSAFEDVATPFEPIVGKEDCMDCTSDGPDGLLDLTLKFDRRAIAEAIGDDVSCAVLTLEGEFLDGTPLVGEDVIRVRN